MPDGVTGTTTGGVAFTITGPGGGYTGKTQGGDWQGQFANSAAVLYDNGDFGAVTITFATPIQSITDITAQATLFGGYTSTFDAYNSAHQLIGVGHFTSDNNDGLNPDTIPGFSFTSSTADISYIVLSTTDDGQGVGLGPTATEDVIVEGVPEPATWTLLLVGFGGLGAGLRLTRRKTAGAIA